MMKRSPCKSSLCFSRLGKGRIGDIGDSKVGLVKKRMEREAWLEAGHSVRLIKRS